MSQRQSKAPETLAERFWSLARGMERDDDSTEPVAVVEHVLKVLDAFDSGRVGENLTANTLNFLALLRQYEVKGDMLYASPEQARGEQMDERSLVFSVGVLIFEKLTGRHPFGAEGNPERLARIRRGEMASGVNYFPIVHPELRSVLVKAMGPFPEERWSNLLEMRAQLERFIDQKKNPQDYTGPTRARPLPALPREDEPTQILNRRSKQEPAVDLARMAQVSSRMRRLETQPAVVAEPTAAAPTVLVGDLSVAPRSRKLAGIIGGMLAGAVVASIAFWVAWPEGDEEKAPVVATAPVAPPPSAQPTPAPTAQPTPAPAARPAAPPAAAKPVPRPTTPPAAVAAPTATALSFDLDVGAQNAATATRKCIASNRRVQFGASLLYDPRTGHSRKVYFGATPQLTPVDRQCLDKAFVGLDAGGAPKKTVVVTYNFNVTPTAVTARGRLAPE
jgi:hypothetical protein